MLKFDLKFFRVTYHKHQDVENQGDSPGQQLVEDAVVVLNEDLHDLHNTGGVGAIPFAALGLELEN